MNNNKDLWDSMLETVSRLPTENEIFKTQIILKEKEYDTEEDCYNCIHKEKSEVFCKDCLDGLINKYIRKL